MADVHVIAAGAWDADKLTVWSTGDVPATGDNIIFDGAAAYAVVVDIAQTPVLGNITCSGTGIDGYFTCAMGARSYDFRCANATPGTAGASGFIRVSGVHGGNTFRFQGNLLAGGSVGLYLNSATLATTIVGDVTGGNVAAMHAIQNNSTGAVTIAGNITGGSAASAYGVYNVSTGTVTVPAGAYTLTSGSAATTYALYNSNTGTITLNTGNIVIASSSAHAILFNNVGTAHSLTATITGSPTGASNGVHIASTATIAVSGTITGGTGTGTGTGITIAGAGTVNVAGGSTIVGGGANLSYGIWNAAGTLKVGVNSSSTTSHIRGGSATTAYGIFSTLANSTTLYACDLENLTGATLAVGGFSPIIDPGAINNITWVAPGATTVLLAKEKLATEIKKDVVNGSVTGTYAFNVNGVSVTGPA